MSLDALALRNLCLWCEFQSRLLIIINLLLKNFLTALVFSSVKWASRHCQILTGVTSMMPWLRDSEYARHHSYNKSSRQLRLRHGQLRERTSGLTNFQGQLQYTCDVARGTKMAGGELNAYNLYPLGSFGCYTLFSFLMFNSMYS